MNTNILKQWVKGINEGIIHAIVLYVEQIHLNTDLYLHISMLNYENKKTSISFCK